MPSHDVRRNVTVHVRICAVICVFCQITCQARCQSICREKCQNMCQHKCRNMCLNSYQNKCQGVLFTYNNVHTLEDVIETIQTCVFFTPQTTKQKSPYCIKNWVPCRSIKTVLEQRVPSFPLCTSRNRFPGASGVSTLSRGYDSRPIL